MARVIQLAQQVEEADSWLKLEEAGLGSPNPAYDEWLNLKREQPSPTAA